jgi:hypothetical protein
VLSESHERVDCRPAVSLIENKTEPAAASKRGQHQSSRLTIPELLSEMDLIELHPLYAFGPTTTTHTHNQCGGDAEQIIANEIYLA